jgi:hypothetical protein
MGWVKYLIISLGLMLVAQAALARDIERFTDKQGTVHITNLEPRERGNRARPGRTEASLPPSALPTKSPNHPAAMEPAPQAQPPDHKPDAAPNAQRPGLRGSQPEGSTEAGPATDQPEGKDEAAAAAMGSPIPLKRVSWSSLPRQARQIRRGKIAVYRDRHGLIHISNVPAEERPVAPVPRIAAVEQQVLPPAVPVPAWQRASWPVAAPVPVTNPATMALTPSPALTDKTIHRYRDRRGVLHITNLPSPDRLLLQAKLAASTGKIMGPASAHSPPAAPITPAISIESQRPLPGLATPTFKEASFTRLAPKVAAYIEGELKAASQVLAGNTVHCYRDRYGVWHITSNSPPEPPSGLTQSASAKMTWPASVPGLPLSPTPVLIWETGFGGPPPGFPDRTVVARRDHRGVLHISCHAAIQVTGGRDSPTAFLRRVPPFLQFCVMEAAQLYGLPVSLVLALIRQESNFVPQARSPKGAMGLMQLMPGTAALLGVRDPFAPRENILAGCRYFRFLLNYFQGSVPLALAAYNAGSQRVVSAGYRVPAIQETQEFVTRVMGLYCLLEKQEARL